jgi:hypothetical protein
MARHIAFIELEVNGAGRQDLLGCLSVGDAPLGRDIAPSLCGQRDQGISLTT